MKNNPIIFIIELIGFVIWLLFLCVVIINNVRYDIQPTNSQVLVLILLYMMLNIKKVDK